MKAPGDGWISVGEQVPRSGALVWAAVSVLGAGWPVPVVALVAGAWIGGGRVWRDARTGARLDRGGAVVSHWRPLDVPEPPA